MKISGYKIKKIRELLKMSKKEVAENANVTPAYIRKIEQGSSQPTVPVAYSICSALGVTIDEILVVEKETYEGKKVI